jgi:CRP-like cAMP-binding protein
MLFLMSAIFKNHLEKFITINENDFTEIMSFFTEKKVRKKHNLLAEGEMSKFNYFVVSGCLRKFFINEKGSEQTTEFAIENWWITDNIAYERRTTSGFYIQAVENAHVLMIEYQSQEKLLARFPGMERYFRFIYQRAYAAAQMRIKYLYDMSKEQFYLHFIESHPEFAQRVPQYLIASYLGLTPEYLSEIRNKRRS